MVGSDSTRWRWSYRGTKTTTSSSYSYSSSSGTISTGYTSSGSRLSSGPLQVAAMYSDWELDVQNANKKEEQTRYITGLVHEFFKGGGDMGVLERWLTELGVDWVLRLANGACAGNQLMEHAFFDAWRSWIRALAEIVETIGFTTSLFADRGGGSVSVGMHIIVSKEEEQAAPDQFQFARFFKQTMLKMLACVDFLACEQVLVSNSNGFDASYEEEKLSFLLGVHGALSKALPQVRLSSSSCSIQGDMVQLLAAKEAMAGEAIWSKMEEMKTRILESIEEDGNDSSSGTIEGSSDIHRATRTVISYIRLLRTNYSTLARLVSEAATLGKYVPQIGIGEVPPLDSMIIEMASCLEEKLANKSESFSDQRLRFMFLLKRESVFMSSTPATSSSSWTVCGWLRGAVRLHCSLTCERRHGESTLLIAGERGGSRWTEEEEGASQSQRMLVRVVLTAVSPKTD